MKNPILDASRLSYGQKALWFLNQLEPASTAYHLGVQLKLTGPLNERALAEAWLDVVEAHPQLRARFTLRDGRPMMAIDPAPPPLRIATGEESASELWGETGGRPFSLDREAPARAVLVREKKGAAHLLLCLHHIAGDLWSSATILRELSAGYAARVEGRAPTPLGESTSYTAFTAAERHWLESPAGVAASDFWKGHLAGARTEPILTRRAGDGSGGEVSVTLGPREGRLIRRAAKERETTPFAVLLGCYARLLGEETGREELVIGTPATIRDRSALRETVGYLVNAVPVRCPVAPRGGDFLGEIAANAQSSLERRRFPFPVLVERLRLPRTPGTTPLFQSMFAYQSLPRADRALLPLALSTGGARWEFGGGVTAETVASAPFDAQFPVALTLGRDDEGFTGRLQYDGRSVTQVDATRLALRLPSLIEEVLDSPAGGRTSAPELPAARIEDIFDASAVRTPSAIAASERGTDLTYAEVRRRAESLADGLDAALPGRDGPVALQMPSTTEASIMLLAILKSGRAFLPIDPGEPPVRRDAALVRAGACALVTPAGVDPGVLPAGVASLSEHKLCSGVRGATRSISPSRAAYVVFTSGSTGEPKAVEVGHEAVINHARAARRLFGLVPPDRLLQFHTLAFDASFEEIFPAWAAGARVVYEPSARELSFPALLETAERCGVTVLNLPTSYWHTLTAEAVKAGLRPPESLRLVVVGGERASEAAHDAWRAFAPGRRWINTYGPTETTITALFHETSGPLGSAVLPIGRPIDGVTAFVVDGSGAVLPEGEGELLLGGAGLAVGYLGDPETTALKFQTTTIDGAPRRVYRTGDRVRLRPDGEFEYLGRLDRQLKIRGYRVDPEEIERALRAVPGVADSAVRPVDADGGPVLAAWLVRNDPALNERTLRTRLAGRLPSHMVPTRLTFVSRLPRKPSGKLDAGALVRARPQKPARGDRGPREMAALFSELLGHEVGPHDDFFLCGGHSLLAIKLLGRIEARYGARLSVSDFVAAPTPKHLWARLQSAPSSPSAAAPAAIPDATPVSAQQRRALLAHEIGRPALANIVLLLRLEGRLDEDALARALADVVQTHPLLRCSFLMVDGAAALRETAERPRLERRALPEKGFAPAVSRLAVAEGRKPFMLDGGAPWLRLLLVSSPGGRSRRLILIAHHAVADGWAYELLLEDLRAAYERAREGSGRRPAEARDYRAYALAQARWLGSPEAEGQAAFWRRRLAGAEEPRLPFRRPPAVDASWRIERRETVLPLRLSRDLRRVAARFGTTPFALMMASFKAQIHRYGGQSDVVLGTMVSNRAGEAEQRLLGPLQNPALIRDTITPGARMSDLARAVALSLGEAQDHGALPFERVLRETLPHKAASGLDLGIQFLSHDRNTRAAKLGGAAVRPVELPLEESPFELTLAVSAASPRIKIAIDYRPDCYSERSVEQLARQYAAVLQSVVDSPGSAVGDLNLTPAAESRTNLRRVKAARLPQVQLLHAGFEAQARRKPGALAVAARDRRLTYGELNGLAESTAGALAGAGLKPGGLVAVMLPKGWKQVVACVAILKAGGVYVPVDPAQPAARLDAVFNQGGFHSAITEDALESAAPWARRLKAVLTLKSPPPSRAARRAAVKPDALAYVIFTSGSTGVPKGVMVTHQAAMTTIREINRRFELGPSDKVFAVSSLGFDLSVFDIFGTLGAGGTIVIPAVSDPKDWLEQAVAEKVTVWNSVPCLFELLLDEAAQSAASLKDLRVVMLSGDFVSLALARRARAVLPRARLSSLGGATEGAIWSIAREIREIDADWRAVPYGRALKRQEMFVLDAALEHCSAGVTGEIFIAGAGLASGYWRNPGETRRRFLTHPRWNIRLYRTGDQGRYLPGGELEILGRLDEQVKINGVRLELGEVEAALASHASVRQALADVRVDEAGQKRLVAFVVAAPGTAAAELSAHARKTLPAALVPSAFVLLERLPLTANGKVDRGALRSLRASTSAPSANKPETPAEIWIADLWSGLLGGAAVGADDDFFALGGHSLLAIRMFQRVRARFGADLPLSLIVERPTVRGLAQAVTAASGGAASKGGLPRRATAELEADSDPHLPALGARPRSAAKAVLLSGATGHLGAALLAEILNTTDDRVYCVVRAASIEEGTVRIRKSLGDQALSAAQLARVEAVPADLSRERLGLGPAEFVALAGRVREIYHCAAEVNFIAPYEKLAASNVRGVREMIRLAAAGGATLHHVSSVAVFPYGGGAVLREDEDITRFKTLTGGYAQSKWTAERMVWRAVEQGLRAVVYRPAQIVGRAADGPPHDLFDHALKACRTLRAVPDLDARMDMVTSEYAAAAIVALSARNESLGKAFHLTHPQPVALREFVERMPNPLPLIPLELWLSRLKDEAARGDDASLQFVAMLSHGLLRDDLTPPSFDCSGAVAGLKGSGVLCPPIGSS